MCVSKEDLISYIKDVATKFNADMHEFEQRKKRDLKKTKWKLVFKTFMLVYSALAVFNSAPIPMILCLIVWALSLLLGLSDLFLTLSMRVMYLNIDYDKLHTSTFEELLECPLFDDIFLGNVKESNTLRNMINCIRALCGNDIIELSVDDEGLLNIKKQNNEIITVQPSVIHDGTVNAITIKSSGIFIGNQTNVVLSDTDITKNL